MEDKNMTALVSLYAKAYHSKNYKYKIFNDFLAQKLLTHGEYQSISKNMTNGINFFNPNYKGNDPLRYIVDNTLSPLILARSLFAENSFKNAIKTGTKQYMVLGSGYDTSSYRLLSKNTNIKIYELDIKEMINDKISRLKKANITNT